MGANLACPCGRPDFHPELKSTNVLDILDTIMIGRLPTQSILFEYSYDKTKIYLINSSQIEEFCNSRNLFKYNTKNIKDAKYFDIFYTTNFLSKRDISMVILQYYSPINEPKNLALQHPKISRFNLVSGIYKIEEYNYTFDVLENIEAFADDLSKKFYTKTLKNFMFIGMLNSEESCFKMVFQRNMNEDFDYAYHIHITEGFLDEDQIRSLLNEKKYKSKLLKAIFVLKINKFNRKNLFIFEENLKTVVEYDYLVISMEKKDKSNEIYVKDVAIKLNDLQIEYKLTSVVSDESKMFVILSAFVDNNNANA